MTAPDEPRSMDDPDAPASEEETRAAEALRAALEDPATGHEDADFARALALAHEPRAIAPDDHRAIVEHALSRPEHARKGPKQRGAVIRIVFGVAAALSLAATLVLVVGLRHEDRASAPMAAALPPAIAARSTQPLFRTPFQTAGGTSARIDRIAMARASDLRDNRFARWGVR